MNLQPLLSAKPAPRSVMQLQSQEKVTGRLTSSGQHQPLPSASAPEATHDQVNTDKSAAVNQSLTWLSIDDHPPPVGAKLLLINRANGVAVLGIYQAKHQWTHWQGLPKFAEEQK